MQTSFTEWLQTVQTYYLYDAKIRNWKHIHSHLFVTSRNKVIAASTWSILLSFYSIDYPSVNFLLFHCQCLRVMYTSKHKNWIVQVESPYLSSSFWSEMHYLYAMRSSFMQHNSQNSVFRWVYFIMCVFSGTKWFFK